MVEREDFGSHESMEENSGVWAKRERESLWRLNVPER